MDEWLLLKLRFILAERGGFLAYAAAGGLGRISLLVCDIVPAALEPVRGNAGAFGGCRPPDRGFFTPPLK